MPQFHCSVSRWRKILEIENGAGTSSERLSYRVGLGVGSLQGAYADALSNQDVRRWAIICCPSG